MDRHLSEVGQVVGVLEPLVLYMNSHNNKLYDLRNWMWNVGVGRYL